MGGYGVARALKSAVPAVEPEDAASMRAAIEAGGPVDIGSTGNFADGVAVRKVGQLTFSLSTGFLGCGTVLEDTGDTD